MGLIKTKGILLNADFKNYDNPFFVNNYVYSVTKHDSLPSNPTDALLPSNAQTYHTVNNVFQHLVDNDKFIDAYITRSQNSSISKDRAIEAFRQDVELTSTIYEETYRAHLEKYHNQNTVVSPSENDQVPLKQIHQQYLNSNFNNLDINDQQFTRISTVRNNTTIKQDVVVNIEFDDSPNVRTASNYVNVYVKNQMTSNRFMTNVSAACQSSIANSLPNTRQTKYIYKQYMSGMKELYIYIPSTFTFYNENFTGADLHDKRTIIRVRLNKRHFQLNHVYNIQINGQTLPLEIHKNESSVFNDVIMPSIVRTVCTSQISESNVESMYDTSVDMYTLYFCCYGSDAQAIKILAD